LGGFYGSGFTGSIFNEDRSVMTVSRNLRLGLGATLGYQVLKSIGLQMTYGGVVAKGDDSRWRMLRLRMTLAF
jgi:hypothetical protein